MYGSYFIFIVLCLREYCIVDLPSCPMMLSLLGAGMIEVQYHRTAQRKKLHPDHATECPCFIFRANEMLHFPSVQEEDKEKLDGASKLRQSEQPVRPTGPVQDAAASEDSVSPVSQQRATQGSFSPQGEVMETDLLGGLSAHQETPCKVLLERPAQSNVGIQTMDHSLCAPETVSAATQTVKSVCEQGTSTVDQNSGKQDATVQTERGSGEKQSSAPVDDTESLHSQVRTQRGSGASRRLHVLCGPQSSNNLMGVGVGACEHVCYCVVCHVSAGAHEDRISCRILWNWSYHVNAGSQIYLLCKRTHC